MIKAKYTALLTGALLAGCFCALTAAQEVTFKDEPCPLTVYTDPAVYVNPAQTVTGSETEETGITGDASFAEAPSGAEYPLSSFEALGVVNDRYVAIVFDGGRTGYVTCDEMEEKVPDLNTGSLDTVTDWTDLGQGSAGDRTMEAQQALDALGLLEGGVDGAFGPGTAASAQRFEQSAGTEENGVIDAADWFLLMHAANSGASSPEIIETSYPPVYTAENKFSRIISLVDDPEFLNQFVDPEWKLTYDTFSGEGRIDYTAEGVDLGSLNEGGREIDRLEVRAEAYIDVKRNSANVVELSPAISVTAQGTHRPYFTSAVLEYGTGSEKMPLIRQEGSLEGQDSVEKTIFALSADIFHMVTAEEDADLILRLKGIDKTIEMNMNPYLYKFSAFVDSCYNIPDIEEDVVEEMMPEPMEMETETEEETEPQTAPSDVDTNAAAYDLGVDSGLPAQTESVDNESRAGMMITENPETGAAPAAEENEVTNEDAWTENEAPVQEELIPEGSDEGEFE